MSRTFKRKQGFLTFAQNSGDTDYLRMAYALALSLKATQSEVKDLSVVVTPGMEIPDKYREVFDEVIDVPWLDEARQSKWKLENEWKSYHITPYEETVKLDGDMLFTTDIAHWWPILGRQDFHACTQVEAYRGELITNDYYRKVFTANNLPNVYTAFMYFKYSDFAKEVFELAEIIFHNWETFFHQFLEPVLRPTFVSTDVVFALALKLLDAVDEGTNDLLPLPRFVHMKSHIQGWPEADDLNENWLTHVPATLTNDLQLKVGLHRQTLPFHYHQKQFLTDEIIRTYEKALGL